MCEQLYLKVFKRLDDLGWKIRDEDYDAVTFAVDKTYEYILSFCNIDEIPNELVYIAVDMAVGEFLMDKYSVNEVSGYIDGGFVKSITEGDVSVSYSNGEACSELEELIDTLMDKKDILYSYRRLKW